MDGGDIFVSEFHRFTSEKCLIRDTRRIKRFQRSGSVIGIEHSARCAASCLIIVVCLACGVGPIAVESLASEQIFSCRGVRDGLIGIEGSIFPVGSVIEEERTLVFCHS